MLSKDRSFLQMAFLEKGECLTIHLLLLEIFKLSLEKSSNESSELTFGPRQPVVLSRAISFQDEVGMKLLSIPQILPTLRCS